MSNEPIHNDYDATDDIFAVEFIVIYLWWSVCVCERERDSSKQTFAGLYKQ